MTKNFQTIEYEGILFDLSVATAGEAAIKLTIGALGPRRKCSAWQEDFERWGNKFEFKYVTEPDTGQKGIRRREMSVIVDSQSLLEVFILDIRKYNEYGALLDHNDKVFAAQRKARKDKLHPSDVYITPPKKPIRT